MESSWAVAEALLSYPQVADLMAERHRIIGNNWQKATPRSSSRATCAGRSRSWSASTSHQPRYAKTSPQHAPHYLYAAAELINHAADPAAASSALTNENERRWRTFHERVEQITTQARAR